MVKKMDTRVWVAGVGVDSIRKDRLLSQLRSRLVSRGDNQVEVVFTPNPEQVVQAQADDAFRSVLNGSDVNVPDGIGLVWAVRILGRFQRSRGRNQDLEFGGVGAEGKGQKIGRIPGVELAEELVEICVDEGLRVMLLGGKQGIAKEAVRRMTNHESRISNVDEKQRGAMFEVLGVCGAVDITQETREEREKVLEQIRRFRPALLLVGYGAPWQEKWVAANREELDGAGVRVVMVVGGAFDVWAGRVRRAPEWIRQLGLEWGWRLVQQPWRWRRQLRLIRFGGLVIMDWCCPKRG